MKNASKEKAITLRRDGLSYAEILKQIPVAKSTLSLWLREVSLSKRQKQRLTKKKLEAMRRGSIRQHEKRLEVIAHIKRNAVAEFKKYKSNPLWLIGVVLYWAEGSKEKETNIGGKVAFSNSDPRMILLFRKWLLETIHISYEDISYELYIHETGEVSRALQFWSKVLRCQSSIIRVYFKRGNPKTKRLNTGVDYHGLIRICVKRSSTLNRKIAAWVDEIAKHWGVV